MIKPAGVGFHPPHARRVQFERFLVLALGLMLNAGCVQMPQMPVEPPVSEGPALSLSRFILEGRISVKNEAQSISGGIRWNHAPGRDEILLTSPLGQGLAELRREDGRVTLKSAEGQTYVARSGEELLEAILGVRLPVDGLVHWLSAQPRPDSAYDLERDAQGRVARLTQDGWRLEYGRYQHQAERWLPGRIFARRDETLEFRLVVDTWQVD